MICPACSNDLPVGSRFCNKCGVPVGLTGVAPVRLREPASYTPRHLVDKILTVRSAVEGERKLVTVLFCDIANSTQLSERIGPDRMHALLNRFFEVILGEVHRLEGTVNQFLGDGVMALFGAPLAFEDHARRGVLAALRIQQALQAWRGDFDPATASLAVRIGLNSGPVVVGKIGDDLRMDYTAVGDTTNLAARMQQIANPGAVYLSEHTHELVQQWVECRALGHRAIKGKPEALLVYEAVRPRERPKPSVGSGGIGTKLIARRAEEDALATAIEHAANGKGGIVWLIGEAGLGKSRLITEVRRRMGESRVRWLEGRGLSFGQMLSYWPFLEILRAAGGMAEDGTPAESWSKLSALVTGLFPEGAEEILPYLASMLGLPVPSELQSRVKHLDARAMGRQVLLTSRRVFERLARQCPLVLVFEDLHWVDQSSTELIEHLFPLVEHVPLVLCGVSRPDPASPAARLREVASRNFGARYTETVLAPLSTEESGALFEGLLETGDVSPRLRDLVLAQAEGNPFFMEEVIRSLIAMQVLTRDRTDRAWRIAIPVDQIRIPETIQGVIMARVDRLDEGVKQVLKIAAVIGRSFLYRVLDAIVSTDRQLDRQLIELEGVELIRERRRLPDLEYIFKHALVQEATYSSILVERRRDLHLHVAECIEELFGARLEEFYGVLAYHYAAAEVWEKAQRYLFMAGDQAGRVAADAEALAHYRRAMEAYGRAFGDRWEPLQRAALERKIGEALFRRGDHHQGLEYLQRALGYLDIPYPASRSRVRLALLREAVRQIGHRWLPQLFLSRRVQREHPTAEERRRIYIDLAWIHYFTDHERLVYDCIASLNRAEEDGFEPGMVSSGVGLVLDLVGLFGVAQGYHDRAVAIAEHVEDATAIGLAYHLLGYHEFLTGEWSPALRNLQHATEIYRKAGALREWGGAAAVIARLHAYQGKFRVALERCLELTQVGEEAGDPQLQVWGLTTQSAVWRCVGNLEGAMANDHAAMELCRSIPDYEDLAYAGGNLGWCRLRKGDFDGAIAMLEEASTLADERGLKGHETTFAVGGLAEAYVAKAAGAHGHAQAAALKKAKRACRAALRQGRLFHGGAPSAMRCQGTYEWVRGKPAAARRWWERSLSIAHRLGAQYDVGMTSLEMGRRTADPALLKRAEAVFLEIGAELDLATTRRLQESLAAAL
jgi:class 3 adenylate cyclase/tetratricopeptide (TPR) repeat protein